MGLKRFDYKLPGEKKNYQQIVLVLCVCLIAVLSYTSYALYQTDDQTDIVNSKVGKFVGLTIMIDGEKSEIIPGKTEGKVFDKIECNNGTASWDEDAWELTNIETSGPTECTISFITKVQPEVPVLDNGLIPVIYKDNEWIKADTTKQWYNYDEQWWANAVTVTSSTRSTYTSAAANTPINMNDIETMWVWIPRYEYNYKLLEVAENYGGTETDKGTKAQPKGIEINFISKDVITPSSDNFTIHDAFWWDNNNNGTKDNGEQLSGIWVAKFEMSVANSESNTIQNPIIKPNVISWRYAEMATFWTAIHNNMNGASNVYGLSNSDTHLMKNMEWGAVAYLSQSKYGKYGNSNYTGTNKEVAINNCSTYKTGIGGDTVSAADSSTTCTTNTYETEKGQGASTTGNIYGIYDMNGGGVEIVMGFMKESSNTEPAVGVSTADNSGWSGKLANGADYIGTYGQLNGIGLKYYDLYNYGTNASDFSRYHKGDATFETKGWYSNFAYFVNERYPLFYRGGAQSDSWTSGVFSMYNVTREIGTYNITSRPVLVHVD